MKKSLSLLGVALGLALLVTGCDTDGSSARIQEKSAVYATLKPWQKKDIDTGVIALTFTPDMVYMAIGNATKVEPMDTPEGKAEVWTYKNYYPTLAAGGVRFSYNSDSHATAGNSSYTTANGSGAVSVRGGAAPTHSGFGNGAVQSSTSGPQGGSMEPAAPTSYTLVVTFQDGKVTKLKLAPN